MEGKKLSKRDKSLKQFIEDYKNEGYCPEAIFNFLALLGWTAADASEIMSKEELIKKFDPSRLSKSPSKFDIVKMEWFSKQYLKKISNEELIKKLNLKNDEWSNAYVETYKQHCATILELKNDLKLYTNVKSKLDIPFETNDVVKHFYNLIKNQEFTIENIQKTIEQVKNDLKVSGKNLFMPIRIATTYEEHGPELAKAIYLFGQKVVLERLKKWS